MSLPASGYFENADRTEGEAKQALEDQRDFIAQFPGGSDLSELTISGGAVTPTIGNHTIDTESDDASDDLDTIATTNFDEGQLLLIRAEDTSRTVVVKHEAGGAGQIHTVDAADITLDDDEAHVLLQLNGTDWYEVFRSFKTASATVKGNVELATNAEVLTGTDTERAVTPDGVADLLQYAMVWIPASSMIPCTTDGAEASTEEYGTNDIDLDVLAFDGGATEERAQFTMVMPPTWDRSTIKAVFYWSNASGASASDTVEWAIKAGALSNDDAIDAALGTAQVISDTLIAAGDLHVTSATPAITVGGTPALGDLVQFEVYRNTDGTDDMEEDAWLIGVLIQYKNDKAVAAW